MAIDRDAPIGVTYTESIASGVGNSFTVNVPSRAIVTFVIAAAAADFDADGDIDGADFLAWQAGYGLESGAGRSQGDANGDGAVNGADLILWRTQVGQSSAALEPGITVPEPAVLALASLGAIALDLRWIARLHAAMSS